MKRFYLLFVIMFFSAGVFAQPGSKGKSNSKHFDIENFQKQKADFIISEVNLTPAEAAVFIPLMNELTQKKFELNRSVRNESRQLKKNANATSVDYDRYMRLSLDSDIKEAELNKEYYDKFRKTLSPEKIYKYQKAETKFMKKVINKELKTK